MTQFLNYACHLFDACLLYTACFLFVDFCIFADFQRKLISREKTHCADGHEKVDGTDPDLKNRAFKFEFGMIILGKK